MKNLVPVSRLLFNQSRWSGVSLCANVPTPVHISARTHLGYIPFSGRKGRMITNHETFLLETRKINLQPVKKATFCFDPIREDFQSIRNFLYFFNRPKVLDTNIKIVIKTDIVDDRREPMITLDLDDGRTLEIKTGNLTELDILRVMNYYVLPLVKEEQKSTETKSAKSKGGGAAGKKKKK
eukprot:TRINITY_DN11418_c0_g1_i11.p2 TRINITY_DN11418_c0_g1~~TRINITY_DN11418_c0_g1_i11.p2  ORF type:complete len:181 (-),score=41.22 TRINITY_DN11418_c0_g1_i11:1957-2499(-)